MRKPESKARNGNEPFKVLWDTKALKAVENIYNYILEKSFQGAETVKEEIFDAVESLKQNPERFGTQNEVYNLF